MIANVPKKRVDGGSSFASLYNYMRFEVNEDTGEILDRGLAWVSNACIAGDSIAVKEMMIVAAMNPLVKDPVYHYVLSWHPSEKPEKNQWQDSVKTTLDALGFKGHQACSVPHDDTAAFHVHVMVNRVHPDTYRAHAPEWSHYSLDEACRILEKRFGWSEARGLYRWDVKLDKPVKTEKELLAKWRFEREEEGKTATGKPAKMEHYSDRESLESYCKGEPAKALRALIREPEAATWDGIHGILMEHGLRLNAGEKGGFTVSNEDQIIHVKASKVFRDLFSGKEMQAWRDKNLGPFQQPSDAVVQQKPKTAYRAERVSKRDPVTRELRKQERRVEREGLFTRYKEAKAEFEAAALPELHQKKELMERQLKGLQAVYRADRARVKASDLDATLKQLSYGMLRADHLQRQATLKNRLAEAKKAAKFVSREDWIAERAEQGDNAAIAYMRGQHYAEQRKKKLAQEAEAENSIQPATPSDYMPRVRSHTKLSWQFDRTNASVVYQLDGKAVFTDRGPRIDFTPDGMTDEGIVAALQIARSKYGKTLNVSGSPAFRMRVAQLAYEHRHQLGIEFADPAMQQVLHGPTSAVPRQEHEQPAQAKPVPSAGIEARAPNEQTGRYTGEVRAIDAEYVYQDAGRGDMVKHRLAALSARPTVGDKIRIRYQGGAGTVEVMVRSNERGKEL